MLCFTNCIIPCVAYMYFRFEYQMMQYLRPSQEYQQRTYSCPSIVFLHTFLRTLLMSCFPSQARFEWFIYDFLCRVSTYIISLFVYTRPIYCQVGYILSQVIVLDVDLPVKQAFHILHEQVITDYSKSNIFIPYQYFQHLLFF